MKFRAGITGRRNSNERKTKSSCSGYNKIALGDGSEVPCNCDSSGRIECPAFYLPVLLVARILDLLVYRENSADPVSIAVVGLVGIWLLKGVKALLERR